MSESERRALRERAAAAIVPPSNDARSLALRLLSHPVLLPCSSASLVEVERAREQEHKARAAAVASVTAAWDAIGDSVSTGRMHFHTESGERARAYEALLRAAARPSDWQGSRGRIHHWQWRAIRLSDVVAAQGERAKRRAAAAALARSRNYPQGYASSRASWRYRAGGERSTVIGGVGSVKVAIAHSEVSAFVPPDVAMAAAANGESEALAVKWALRFNAVTSPVLIWTYEAIDYSLRASGTDTSRGYSHERSGPVSGPVSGSVSPLVARIRRLAAAARKIDARAARVERWKAERRAAERKAERARAAAALAALPRLVK